MKYTKNSKSFLFKFLPERIQHHAALSAFVNQLDEVEHKCPDGVD